MSEIISLYPMISPPRKGSDRQYLKESVLRELKETKHVQLSSLWIHECLEHLSQNGPWSLEIGLLANYVYNVFLCTDLRLSALKEVLPPDIKKMHRKFIFAQEVVLLQIDEIVNVTTSRQQQKNANEKQLQAGNQSIEIINQEEAENQSNESVGNVGRVNKLLLTDGHQQVVGIDLGEVLFRHVSRGGHNKNVSAGSKIAVKNVFIRRGALILTPASCIFLGGEVKNLHTTLNTSTTTITSSIQTTTTQPMLQPPPQAMTQALPSHAITNHQTVNPAQPNRSYQQQPSTMTTKITQNITQSSHLPLQPTIQSTTSPLLRHSPSSSYNPAIQQSNAYSTYSNNSRTTSTSTHQLQQHNTVIASTNNNTTSPSSSTQLLRKEKEVVVLVDDDDEEEVQYSNSSPRYHYPTPNDIPLSNDGTTTAMQALVTSISTPLVTNTMLKEKKARTPSPQPIPMYDDTDMGYDAFAFQFDHYDVDNYAVYDREESNSAMIVDDERPITPEKEEKESVMVTNEDEEDHDHGHENENENDHNNNDVVSASHRWYSLAKSNCDPFNTFNTSENYIVRAFARKLYRFRYNRQASPSPAFEVVIELDDGTASVPAAVQSNVIEAYFQRHRANLLRQLQSSAGASEKELLSEMMKKLKSFHGIFLYRRLMTSTTPTDPKITIERSLDIAGDSEAVKKLSKSLYTQLYDS